MNLHTHTREGSLDGGWSKEEAARRYRDAGFGAIAITDHDTVTEPASVDGIMQLRGIERTVDGSSHLHVVELVDHDFHILAHPDFTFSGDLLGAQAMAEELNVDAIEAYNSGVQQFPGGDYPEIAGDDSHNPAQLGLSYIEVSDGIRSKQGIVDAIRGGNYEIVVNSSRARRLSGHLWKAIAYEKSLTRPKIPGDDRPSNDTALY